MKAVVVGAGRAGKLHAAAYQAMGVPVVAVVEPNSLASGVVLPGYQGPVYQRLSDMPDYTLKGSIVSVCSPVDDHFASAQLALAAGAHVLVEKPATHEEGELRHLYRVAEEGGLCFSPVHNQRFLPGYRDARDLIKSGALGPIEAVVRFMSFTKENVRMMEPGHWSHLLPGGRLFEANPHNLYLAHSMFSESFSWKLLAATGHSDEEEWPGYPVTSFSALLSSGSSTITIYASLCHDAEAYGGPRFHADSGMVVLGRRGTLLATPAGVRHIDTNKLSKFETGRIAAMGTLGARVLRRVRRIVPPPSGSGHSDFISAFVRSVNEGNRRAPVPVEEGVFAQSMNRVIGKAVQESLT